jgi:DnaK suppressor protein
MNNHLDRQNKLEAQLLTVTQELSNIGTLDATTDDWEAIPDQEESGGDADENTHADASEDLNERTATLTDLERQYRDTKRALAKIANGTYGLCEICGGAIEEKRLDFKPDARTCLAHLNEGAILPM